MNQTIEAKVRSQIFLGTNNRNVRYRLV